MTKVPIKGWRPAFEKACVTYPGTQQEQEEEEDSEAAWDPFADDAGEVAVLTAPLAAAVAALKEDPLVGDRELVNLVAQAATTHSGVVQCMPIFDEPANFFLHFEVAESMIECMTDSEAVQAHEKQQEEAEAQELAAQIDPAKLARS